jgi:hypothetical protein
LTKIKKTRAKDQDLRDKSWVPGQQGQGGEGLSKGYGGSAGQGTGASGPDGAQNQCAGKEKVGRDADRRSLPSRERISKVLR